MKLHPALIHAFSVRDFLKKKYVYIVLFCIALVALLLLLSILFQKNREVISVKRDMTSLGMQLHLTEAKYQQIKNQDQYKINLHNTEVIQNIQTTYQHAVTEYEQLLDLKNKTKETQDLDNLFTTALSDLSKLDYTSASATLQLLSDGISKKEIALAPQVAVTSPGTSSAPSSNALPASGYSLQTVLTDSGSFPVSLIGADLNATRVLVDTASDSDCSNNCPVMALSDYVARNNAFAGINGTFFCPTEYPSCVGKTNSFDTLLLNKNKHYFNSANNVYSTVPLVYFSGNQMGVRSQSLNWGRDTGVDSVIAMQPLLISTGNIVFGGSGDSKFTNKGTRDFIANKANMVYIGVIYNADMNDAAKVLKALGVDNALNLDEGGSTALWYGGYKAGPGRNIPNAIVLVRK